MKWLSYLYPQTVARLSSDYNRDIRINEERGRLKLLVDGARESGEYIEDLWRVAFRELGISSDLPVKRVLILGIAGGTVIRMLHTLYPDARITGVDIDQVMIDVGKTYFGLDSIGTLQCICADAREFVAKDTKKYDLIVTDVFIGPNVPDFVIDRLFEANTRKRLSPGGRLFINYLREPGYETKAESLRRILTGLYRKVSSADYRNNRFFRAE